MRPELWGKAAEIFGRTANGCGHRQIAMCLRAGGGCASRQDGAQMMREIGISCGIRRETDYYRYNSTKRHRRRDLRERAERGDFTADGPWRRWARTSPNQAALWGKAYFAVAFDFGSCEIAAWSISRHPDMAQQMEMLDMLLPKS